MIKVDSCLAQILWIHGMRSSCTCCTKNVIMWRIEVRGIHRRIYSTIKRPISCAHAFVQQFEPWRKSLTNSCNFLLRLHHTMYVLLPIGVSRVTRVCLSSLPKPITIPNHFTTSTSLRSAMENTNISPSLQASYTLATLPRLSSVDHWDA